jgi:single-stranded DNA-binding protein
MLNSCVIVGKVLKEAEFKDGEYQLLLECNRPYRMEEGNVKTDVFTVMMWKGLAEQCKDMCKQGDVLAVRGRLEGRSIKIGDIENYFSCIIAEKISFVLVHGKTNGITY